MRKPTIILLLAVRAIAGSLAVIYRTQFQNRAPETSKLPEGLGTAVAEETTKLLTNQGKVVLILPQRGNYKDPLVELQRAAFAKTLARTKGVSLLATESIETERPGTMGAAGLDPEQFRQFVQRHAGADAFVSLAGFPEFSKEAVAELTGKKFVVLGNAGPHLKAMLLAGTVQVAILPRTRPVTDGKKPGTAREWFNFTHEVITPANASALP